MNYKIINDSLFEKLFPKTKFTNENEIYSFYLFGVQNYLNKILFLSDLNNSFKSNNLGVNIKTFYNDLSNLNLEYVFILNNFILDNLTEDEYNELNLMYKNKDFNNLENFTKKTYKKLLDNNGILLLGVLTKDDKRIDSFLKEKIDNYLEILNIPVRFINLNKEIEKKQEEILKKYPKFLPLGSIVLLKEGTKKLMIAGYSIIDLENKEKVYDYIAYPYPEGIHDKKENIVFNHKDIKSLIALGYKNDESNNFIEELVNMVDEPNYMKEVLERLNNL